MLREKIFCGLDLGSQQIKTSLVKINKHTKQPELLATRESATRGLRKSTVSDLSELSESINDAMAGLSKKVGIKIRDVRLGIGGFLVESRLSNAIIPLVDKNSKVITFHDVRKVNEQARLLGIRIEEEVVHDFIQSYTIDDQNNVTNPLGLYGRKLSVNLLLLIANINLLNNIVKAVHQAGYEIVSISLASLAAAEATLTKKEKSDGCVLMDMGASTTNILIFEGGFFRQLNIINVGGADITASIAQALDLPLELAEDIKRSYAVALNEETAHQGEILVKKESSYYPVKREVIDNAVDSEITKRVSLIKETIRGSCFYEKLNAGIIMAGGGALLPGLMERIEKEMNLPVKVGKINMAPARLNNAAVFSAAIGLAQAEIKRPSEQTLVSFGDMTWLNRFAFKIREFYQEYF